MTCADVSVSWRAVLRRRAAAQVESERAAHACPLCGRDLRCAYTKRVAGILVCRHHKTRRV